MTKNLSITTNNIEKSILNKDTSIVFDFNDFIITPNKMNVDCKIVIFNKQENEKQNKFEDRVETSVKQLFNPYYNCNMFEYKSNRISYSISKGTRSNKVNYENAVKVRSGKVLDRLDLTPVEPVLVDN